jgi:hypothetical protein
MELGPSEFVKEVSGMVGVYKGETVVSAIKLVTNVKTFGPFGKGKDGTMFSVPVQGGSGIATFFGRSGKYLNAIGVYVAPRLNEESDRSRTASSSMIGASCSMCALLVFGVSQNQ